MDEVTYRLLTSWELRPVLFSLFSGFAVLYTVGWWRLRQRGRQNKLASVWRLLSYWIAIIVLTISLMSPIDVLSADLFLMHMVQHLLMTMVSAPLLMLANPMPFVLWGLPDWMRRDVGQVLSYLLHRKSKFRDGLRAATSASITWMIMVAVLWLWHDGNLYSLAQGRELIHDVEHITFYASALLFWWRVTGAGPRVHAIMSLPARVGYLLAGIPSTFILGAAIAFSTTVIYPYYETRPRLWGLSVIDDQMIGGIIMWVGGSMMYLVAALIVIGLWLNEQEKKAPLPPVGQTGKTASLPATK